MYIQRVEMRKTYRYRLYRSKRDKHLVRQIELASEIWNHFVVLTRRYHSLYGKYPGYYKLKRHLAKLKKRNKTPWYGLNSQAGQNVIERLDGSYQRLFEGKGGRPGFKKRRKYPSFTLTQTGWKYLGGNRLRIMGHTFKFCLSRPLEGEVKTVTIKRDRCGDLWVCFSVVQDVQPTIPQTGSAVGIDFGLKDFLTMSDGQTVESPQHLRASLKEMARHQRALSRKQKGSNNRRTARVRVAKLHRRVADQRRDFHFKTARAVFQQHDVVAVEDLNLDGMKRMWGSESERPRLQPVRRHPRTPRCRKWEAGRQSGPLLPQQQDLQRLRVGQERPRPCRPSMDLQRLRKRTSTRRERFQEYPRQGLVSCRR